MTDDCQVFRDFTELVAHSPDENFNETNWRALRADARNRLDTSEGGRLSDKTGPTNPPGGGSLTSGAVPEGRLAAKSESAIPGGASTSPDPRWRHVSLLTKDGRQVEHWASKVWIDGVDIEGEG